VEWLIIRVRKG